MSKSYIRQPDSRFEGTNGFSDSITVTMAEAAPELGGPLTVKTPQELRELARKRYLVETVLCTKGSYGPGLAAMQEEINSPETSAMVKSRMEELQKKHVEEMHKLSDLQAQEYLADALDAYLAKDDGINVSEIDHYYQTQVDPSAASHIERCNTYSEYRYAYLRTFIPMLRQRATLASKEQDARRKRDAQFPGTVADYRALRERDMQARVARFLAADKYTKERMMSEFGWVYRQVKPLEDEYARDTMFRTEIQNAIREGEVKDPRRRASWTSAA